MQLDRNELDNYITGHYGEDQELGEDEPAQEENEPFPMTPYAAVYREVLDLCGDIHRWEGKDDPHGVLPWLVQRRAALEEAMRLLDEYQQVKKALAVLKAVI